MSYALELDDLKKIYANGLVALHGISLEVMENDFFALLGPNGAGKSTAIGIITSLVNKTGGRVRVFGADLDTDPVGVKRQIGVVPQEFNFNQFEPVIEIIVNQAGFYGIPRREAYQRAKKCLKQLDIWGKKDSQARDLSGGMKRRLMISRALVHNPRLLILDEPTAGVDIEIRTVMWNFLREINAEGTTVILTTHYLEEAESLCRNIAIINHGRIVENAAMTDLLGRLHAQSFILNLADPVSAEIPEGAFGLKQLDNRTLEACITEHQRLNDLLAYMDSLGLQVTSMRNKQNRLEQLFMDMVGNGRPK